MGHKRSRNRQTSARKAKYPSLLERINRNAAGGTFYFGIYSSRDQNQAQVTGLIRQIN